MIDNFSFLLLILVKCIHPESWDKTALKIFLKDYQDIYFFGDRVLLQMVVFLFI